MGTKQRIDVMLSSTFLDLEDHRAAVIAAMNGSLLTPLAQEFDAALSDSDLIKASLDKVDAADAYVGLIGSRYGQRPRCATRNPDRLSLTELEYRRAVERKLPRLMFIMGDDHGLKLADLKRSRAEGDKARRLHEKFIERAYQDRVTAEFSSVENLETRAVQSFLTLQKLFLQEDQLAAAAAPTPLPTADESLAPAPPAFHYYRKPYIEKQGFAGREKELSLIDQWAAGADPVLLFQGIGGMGKSMLTWHWLRTRAARLRADWAGRFWYSFYEQGADLNDFCIQALSYVRHEPPKLFRGRRTLDLANDLFRELDARPWLIALDGLERVLVAYNRVGKDHMTDEEAIVVRDDMGLDREPHDCFRAEDGDALSVLAQPSHSKLLMSSRLTPASLTNEAGQPIPGVRRARLEGLAPEDAELVLRNAGVRGDGWRIRQYLERNFAGHPLSTGIVAGQVMTFHEARGDFDLWVEHRLGGADPALIAKDLRGRQNHILARAFDNLDDDEKAFLGSVAMAGSLALTPDILRLLNPKRPIAPKRMEPPSRWSEKELYLRSSDPEIDRSYFAWSSAKSSKVRAEAQATIDILLDKNLAERTKLYDSRVLERASWKAKAALADEWLVQALPRLEARGLLQYDSDQASLDMHPAIRHTVLVRLSPDARNSAGSHVSDALSSRPVKPFYEARTLDDLALALTRVEALNSAGKLEDGWRLFISSGLGGALSRLYYSYQALELLQPYFPEGWSRGPTALHEADRSDALNSAVRFLWGQGKIDHAITLLLDSIAAKVGGKGELTPTPLNSLAICLAEKSQFASAERIRNLAIRLAGVRGNEIEILLTASVASGLIRHGRMKEAEPAILKLREAIGSERVDPTDEAMALKADLRFRSAMGDLDAKTAEGHLGRLRAIGNRFEELWGLAIVADWRQSQGDHIGALDAYGELIALANETGWTELARYEARRAISLVAIGRQEEARRIAAKLDRGKSAPNVELALLYLEIEDKEKALGHAMIGYEKAWAEGPPYHVESELEDCRKVLAALGAPEPVLEPFRPAEVEHFDFEPEIERLIERKLAEKAEAG